MACALGKVAKQLGVEKKKMPALPALVNSLPSWTMLSQCEKTHGKYINTIPAYPDTFFSSSFSPRLTKSGQVNGLDDRFDTVFFHQELRIWSKMIQDAVITGFLLLLLFFIIAVLLFWFFWFVLLLLLLLLLLFLLLFLAILLAGKLTPADPCWSLAPTE